MPAIEATERPAPSLPVNVAAATRSSSRIAFTRLPADEQGLEDTFGEARPPAASSMLSAVWGTFEACFKRATLPTMKVGAAKRMTCQSGKFHGMTASTGPIGWYLM